MYDIYFPANSVKNRSLAETKGQMHFGLHFILKNECALKCCQLYRDYRLVPGI